MSVTIKRPEELELMREAGKILAKVHEQLGNELRPGMSTYEIDRIGEEMIRSFGCEPSFKNYCGYPASVCVSIDEEVVHGIPSKEKFIQEGDIVSLDIGVIHKGYHSDAARTHAVGEISKEAELLIERTRQSFFEGMKYAAAGRHLYEISGAIGSYAESFGYGVVRDLCGHGIVDHQQAAFQIGTGKTVVLHFLDAAVAGGISHELFQHQSDAGLALAALADNEHHLLPLGAGDQAVAQIFLQGGDVGIVQQLVQKGQPAVRAGGFGVILHRQAVLAEQAALLKRAIRQMVHAVLEVDAVL